ncbi:hypothetical protein FBEOM_7147 [Fusarium beomiforme]|uniref:Uncharacterized protein n=1 Tax=Fusarium beomiforme TaxID=44412 RepID=A0A9P5AI24_9HYPO|nr:hypothetical protein FBEOM_7147 [Fusarium beomiforme]
MKRSATDKVPLRSTVDMESITMHDRIDEINCRWRIRHAAQVPSGWWLNRAAVELLRLGGIDPVTTPSYTRLHQEMSDKAESNAESITSHSLAVCRAAGCNPNRANTSIRD